MGGDISHQSIHVPHRTTLRLSSSIRKSTCGSAQLRPSSLMPLMTMWISLRTRTTKVILRRCPLCATSSLPVDLSVVSDEATLWFRPHDGRWISIARKRLVADWRQPALAARCNARTLGYCDGVPFCGPRDGGD